MEKPKIGVFIGRFQPVTNAHLAVIKMALEEMDYLTIVLGSACQAKTVRNPFSTKERENMIRSCLEPTEVEKLRFIVARDYLYNDNLWLYELQSNMGQLVRFRIDSEYGLSVSYEATGDITLYGHDKDRSTNYLHLFPHWKFNDVGKIDDVDSEKVLELFFRKDTLGLSRMCPEPVVQFLQKEIAGEEYQKLYNEFKHLEVYKEMWASAPFPPIFVTTDAVVIKSGHVLVVKRKGYPGKGLLALPGGFLHEKERIIDGCLRELKEETQIKLPKDELKKRIISEKVFDYPYRSLRGRTITHAFCFDLGSGALPKVKGDDDAEKAFWIQLRDINLREEEFFEDHWHIINFFVNRG